MAFDHSGRTAGSFLVVSSPLLSEGYRSRIYRRLRLRWIAAILVGACVATAAAAPVVLVTDGGLSGGGNQLWNLAIGPDVPSFAAETSLEVEIGIEFSSPILSAALDDAFWNEASWRIPAIIRLPEA